MSGETEAGTSGWTPDLLFVHLQSQLDAMSRMLDERYATQTTALNAARTADKEFSQAALLAAKEAVEKANTASEKRFEAVNEFRAQLGDIISTLIPRAEAETRFRSMDEKVDALTRAVDRGFSNAEGGKSANQQNWGLLVGAVSLVALVITTFWNLSGR